MDEIFVRRIKFPYKVPASTVLDDDGDYNVYINTEICPAKQKLALKHELSHIENNHFYDEKPVDEDENEADLDAESDIKIDKRILPSIHWEGYV